MNPEDAAQVLFDYWRWLSGKDEHFEHTRAGLARACEIAGRVLDDQPKRKFCHDCVHWKPCELPARKAWEPPAEIPDSAVLCMKGHTSWHAMPENGDPYDGGFYRPGCRDFYEEGASSEWRPPRLREA